MNPVYFLKSQRFRVEEGGALNSKWPHIKQEIAVRKLRTANKATELIRVATFDVLSNVNGKTSWREKNWKSKEIGSLFVCKADNVLKRQKERERKSKLIPKNLNLQWQLKTKTDVWQVLWVWRYHNSPLRVYR
jgi:hypothetical protein